MRHIWSTTLPAALCGAWLSLAPAMAETVQFHADLSAKSETPPTDSSGKGSADVTYDSAAKKLTWRIDYSGLTGPATAAHFHGPAETGKPAGVAVPITGDLSSPLAGSATITDAQAQDLMDGKYYINLHTGAHKDGEIRGQVTKGAAAKAG
jgi:hypothetical protein